jgi:hypothetical protein
MGKEALCVWLCVQLNVRHFFPPPPRYIALHEWSFTKLIYR